MLECISDDWYISNIRLLARQPLKFSFQKGFALPGRLRIVFEPGSVRERLVPLAEMLHCLNEKECGSSSACVVTREV
jgi:hypothetical protein